MTEDEFRLLRELVHAHCGIYFRDDTRYLLERRLGPRLEALGLRTSRPTTATCASIPRAAPSWRRAIELLTTNETYFFREPLQLDAFARGDPPRARRARTRRSARLRILSAGCSTGEEAYTIAMLVKESRPVRGLGRRGLRLRHLAHGARPGARRRLRGARLPRAPEAEPMRRWFNLRGGKLGGARGDPADGPLRPPEPARRARARLGVAARRHLLPQRDDLLRPAGAPAGAPDVPPEAAAPGAASCSATPSRS